MPSHFDGKLLGDLRGVRFHLVGVKGTGMAALAEILSARGAVLTGSDVSERFYTDEVLEGIGLKPLPFSGKNVGEDTDFVVHSSAYSAEKTPDLAEAERLKIPTMLYSEALGALSAGAFSCGICGVHGKTTTTGMVGTILKFLDLPSQALAGSVISSFGNTCTMTSDSLRNQGSVCGRKFFVAETCEYQRHFMSFQPKKIVLTSVESDHQDYYPTYESILGAFVDYACLLPEGGALIYCADDAGACEAAAKALERRPDIKPIPYGVGAEGIYSVEFGEVAGGIHRFCMPGFGELSIKVPGDHNVRNAAAAVALCSELLREAGRNPHDYAEKIRGGLLAFSGGRRRSEVVGRARTARGEDVIFIDDYAHHPTAIRTTLSGFRDFYRGHRIVVDFMSHTYSRTEALLDGFASSFGSADFLILNRVYASAREQSAGRGDVGRRLFEMAARGRGDVFYEPEFHEAADRALEILAGDSGAEDGWLFVTMGAGDNWKVGREVMERLNAKYGENV